MRKERVLRVRTLTKPQSRKVNEARLSALANPNGSAKPFSYPQTGEDAGGPSRKDLSPQRKTKKYEGKRFLPIGYIGRIKEKVKQMRQRLGFGRIENLTNKQLTILNDRSHFSLFDQSSRELEMETIQTGGSLFKVNFPLTSKI
jgi:hypothetical protein